jgi:molybdate/tungstate transport system substrate-binding protein
VRFALSFLVLILFGCRERPEQPKPPITVFAAASLARPLRVLADSFQRRSRITTRAELGGSLDQARKMTELGRTPDVLMLVDDEVVSGLMPTYIDWYVRFATNRLVVAFTRRSQHADSITSENWYRVLARGDVSIGHADPAIAPAGKHALSLLRRAETYYQVPGLADRLFARASLKYVRPNATELAALLETGEVDYILDYESVARQYRFRFVTLPEDLAVPVLYGVSVPRQAAHFQEGVEFVEFVLSDEGKNILRSARVNVLNMPVAIGSAVPPEISQFVRTASATPALPATAAAAAR